MTAPVKAYKVPRAKAPTDLFLDGNEGRGPEADFAARVLQGASERLRRYPDAAPLRKVLAEKAIKGMQKQKLESTEDCQLRQYTRAKRGF